jgi:hypothetical protein
MADDPRTSNTKHVKNVLNGTSMNRVRIAAPCSYPGALDLRPLKTASRGIFLDVTRLTCFRIEQNDETSLQS